MKESTSLILFLLTILKVSNAARRVTKTCKDHNDPSFSACLEESANIYFAALDEEVDGIHHSWKPMKSSVNNGALSVDLVYNITKFINSTKSVKVTLKYDAAKKKLTGTINAPHVGFEANCEVDGKFSSFRLQGVGVATFHVWDMEATYETHLHIKPGSKSKFEMEELKLTITSIKKAGILITELTSKSKALELALKEVTKNFADELYSLGKEQWDINLQMHYEDLTREFLREILDDGLVIND